MLAGTACSWSRVTRAWFNHNGRAARTASTVQQCAGPSRQGELALLLVPSWPAHQIAGPPSSPSTRRSKNGRTGEGQQRCGNSSAPVLLQLQFQHLRGRRRCTRAQQLIQKITCILEALLCQVSQDLFCSEQGESIYLNTTLVQLHEV